MASDVSGAHTAKGGSSQLRRAPVLALALAGVVGLSLLASACGGHSSGAKVAQAGTTASTNGSTSSSDSGSGGGQAFSACMRSHGVPNFPDPGSDGRINAAGIDKGSRTFQGAYGSCRALAPAGLLNEQTRTQLQRQLPQLLAFAACMRAHGVPAFGDPSIRPDGHHIEWPVPRFDTNSPTFHAAAAACKGTLSRDQSSRLFGKLSGGGKQPAPSAGK
jgi:hypothetical protein